MSSTDGRDNEATVLHTHHGIPLSCDEKRNPEIYRLADGPELVTLSEVTQTQQDRLLPLWLQNFQCEHGICRNDRDYERSRGHGWGQGSRKGQDAGAMKGKWRRGKGSFNWEEGRGRGNKYWGSWKWV